MVGDVMQAGVLYFALTFAAGFVLGPIRMLWAVPRFGERTAELMETPIMLAVVILAARWVTRRLLMPPVRSQRLAAGLLALGLLLVAELTLVLSLRGLTIREYVASRDPVSGAVYLATLAAFAVMPLFVDRLTPGPPPGHRPRG